MWVHSNHMGRGDDTPLNLGVVQNGNGLRMLTTQESHGFSHVECQPIVNFIVYAPQLTHAGDRTLVLTVEVLPIMGHSVFPNRWFVYR